MIRIFKYPRWAFAPGRKHATIYISDEQPADVVTYGTRVIHNRDMPIVKFTGFSEIEGAGALSLQRLGEAMGMMINHAARSCRLQVNHSGSVQNGFETHEMTQDGQNYVIYRVPIFMRITAARQVYITLRVWKGGPAAHSVIAMVPQMIFYDIPSAAQFENICHYAADLARSQRP